MAAGVIADGDLLSREVFRLHDRRIGGDHDPAGRHDVGFSPHRSDLLRGRLIDRPMAGAGNIRLYALVAAGLLVGFESPGANLRHLAGCVDLLDAVGCQSATELVVATPIPEIASILSDPFLQPAVRLYSEFSHVTCLHAPSTISATT